MKMPVSILHRPHLRGIGESIPNVVEESGNVTDYYGTPPGTPAEWDFSVLSRAAESAANWITQQRIISINLERAKQGLPPIDSSGVIPAYTVGMSSETKSLVTFALIGLGAILLLKRR